MLKILFSILDENLKGGLPTHLPLLKDELKRFVELDTFNYSRKNDNENIIEKITGRLIDLITIYYKINKFDPDIIHHNTAFDKKSIIRDAPLAFLVKREKAKLFIKIHGSFEETFNNLHFIFKQMRDYLLKNVDGIGVLSIEEKLEFEKKWSFLKGKVFVVKNIIRDEFFRASRKESINPTILFISRLIKKKGPFDLLEAIPLVLEKYSDTQFVFIGSGDDAAEFQSKVFSCEYKSNIVYSSHLANLDTIHFYEKAWMFVFPTHFPEGMPMVIAQAMAMGVPIITTKTRFSLSYMEEGTNCFYLNNCDAQEIANKILFLIYNDSLRKIMSNANKELSKLFKKEKVIKEFILIYNKLFFT